MACFFACFCGPLFWVGVIAGAIYLIKEYMQGTRYERSTTANGKVIIITGCNTGIGRETVRELAKRGATIYMACRDMRKSEEVRQEIIAESGNKQIHLRELDLSSLESIRKFVENFKKDENKLDVLINNAGIALLPRTLTKDGFEMQLGVNHMGHFLLTNLLLDLLKNSAPSRIVVVSSLAHAYTTLNKSDLNSERSYDENKAYYQSKLANVLFTRELAKRLQGTGVTVNALHPGVVKSDLMRHMSLYKNPLTRPLLMGAFWPFMKTTENGAQTTIYAALDPELNNVSGKYFSDCKLKNVAPAALDDDMAKWLWTESEKWTKLNN